jgi:hypothetical protein
MSWLKQFLEATRDSEAPELYFKWAGLSVISAIVKNNVFLDRFHYTLYPNIYVMLIGRSGLRKGIPILYARKLVDAVNSTRVIAGRNSIEAIIRELSTAATSEKGGDIIKDAVGFLISSEFAAFLVRNPDALTILTDLYDGHYNSEWRNSLKGTGVEKLTNVCLTLLGASNEIHFKDVVPLNAVGGGFIARTTLAVSKEKRGSNPLTEAPLNKIDIPVLAEGLKPLVKLRGKFAYSKNGKDAYDKWYGVFDKKVITDTTGTAERLGDHVLKVAMLLSLSRGTSLLIDKSDVEEAVEDCENATKGTQEVFLGHGQQALVKPTTLLLKELLKVYPEGMGRTEVLKKLWGHVDAIELDRIIDTVKQAGFIDTECPGGHWKYFLKEKAYKQILQFTEGKK